MVSLKYAFRFIRACFTVALTEVRLQEQWVYIAVGNLILLLVWFLPLGLVVSLIGFRPIGTVLIGLISIFMLYSFYLWGEITREYASQVMVSLFKDNKTQEENGTQEDNGNQGDNETQEDNETQGTVKFKHWTDILVWTLVMPVIHLEHFGKQFFWPGKEEKYPWFESHALVIPLISLESLSFKEAVPRVDEMISEHLLRFKPGFIKVDYIAKLVQWAMSILGILIGFSIAVIVADPFGPDPWQRILGLGIWLLIGWFFITLGHLFSAFVRSYYHTALYQWAVNVQVARQSDDPTKANPPEILRFALGQSERMIEKER